LTQVSLNRKGVNVHLGGSLARKHQMQQLEGHAQYHTRFGKKLGKKKKRSLGKKRTSQRIEEIYCIGKREPFDDRGKAARVG